MDKLKETLIRIKELYGEESDRLIEPMRHRAACGKIYGVTLEKFDEVYNEVFRAIDESEKMPFETLQLFLEAEEAVNFYDPKDDIAESKCEYFTECASFTDLLKDFKPDEEPKNYDDVPLCQLMEVCNETI